MGVQEKDLLTQLSLPPGFRFYPTDEELLVQYLCRKVAGHHFSLQIIGDIDLYKFDPWHLPSKAIFGEKEWYFFSPRDRKYPNGSRPNRVAGSGYWKATGTDKIITTQGKKVGIKKALVFYIGKAPKGTKTNWIMHEYRLTEHTRKSNSSKLDEWVLCRIYKKKTGSGSVLAKTEPISKEHSTGGSTTSSSSHHDDVPEPSWDTIDHTLPTPSINNSSHQLQQEDNKLLALQHLGSGNLDWSVLAGLTQPEVNANDVFAPTSLPPLTHVESPVEVKFGNYSDGVQSAIRTQRVNSGYLNYNSGGFSQSYTNSVDPFGMLYPNQSNGFGFGFRQ